MASRVAQLRLQLLDQVSGPAKKTSGALGQLERDISKLGKNGVAGAKNLGNQLDHLRRKAAAAADFGRLRQNAASTFAEFRTARDRVKQLEAALQSVSKPTAKMNADLRSARSALKGADNAFRQSRAAAVAAGQGLKTFGLNSRTAANAQEGLRRSMASTIQQMRRMRTEAGKRVPDMARPVHNAAGGRTGRFWGAAAGAATGGYVAGAMLARPVGKALSYDETLTYLAGTMAGDGSVEDKQAAKVRASGSVNRSLQESGGTRDAAAAALNTLVGSGLFEGDSALEALTPILKTAFASGSDPEDVALMGVAFKNSGINSSEDMQLAFDSALRAGQLGGFELRDMARWLPGQLALARGSGLTGLDAVKYLAAANQTQIKTAGSPDEAGNNLVNLLQKLNSRELQKQMANQVKARKGDPLNEDEEFNWQQYMVERRQAGVSGPEALSEILNRQLEDNKAYQELLTKARDSKSNDERLKHIEGALNIAEGSTFGEIFADRQALFGAIALQVFKDQQKQIENQLASSGGAVATESEFVRSQTWSKVKDAQNAADRANEQTYNAVSGPLGDLAKATADAAAAYPGLTAGAYAAATALGALAAGAGLYGLGRTVLGGRRVPGAPGGLAAPSGGSGGARGGIGAGRLGLGVLGVVGSALAIPSDPEELKQFIEENAQRSERWNRYLEDKIGTPRSWLGMGSGGSSSGSEVNKLETDIQATMAQWPIAAQQGMREYIGVLMQGGAEAEAKAQATGEQIKQALTVNGALTIDTSQLERALGLARQLSGAARGGSVVSPSGGSLDPKLDGKRAGGGRVKAGGLYQINEKGQELFAPGADGTIIPNHKIGGGGVTVHAPINLGGITVGAGADTASVKAAVQQGVEQALAQLDAKLSRSLETTWSNLAYGDA
ncbi:phage tail tape measure protein [Brucella anthropi]|uniref:phage tail tape measure protein n=1 Tax=Brucella anthropi TaxID=529 RepID=UPI00124E87D0|nr:phage tail tape measure protein [Brucella anthropi]KAB2738457.1 phage tail tape measure protein [Brucella anthropi]